MTALEILSYVIPAVLGGGAAGGVAVKWLNRDVDTATTGHLHAQARSTNAQAVAAEVQMIRDVLTEVRANDAAKVERLKSLEYRIGKLEERERHMLTRAAVHEAWDQMAFTVLLAHNPDHPPPPPLLPRTGNRVDDPPGDDE